MNKLKCWKCGHEWEYKSKGSYPAGPCPTNCPECNEMCCPVCGGKLGKESKDEDTRMYCGCGCNNGDWEHCGGCI